MHPILIELEQSFGQSILSQIETPLLARNNVSLWIKRDDLIHPIISGNKWRKLKYHLNEVLSLGCDTIISMGGRYSNHLHALAYLGKILKLKTIGIIRGERPTPLTATLEEVQNWGMELRFISRSDYRLYRNHHYSQNFSDLTAKHYWIPEGGANQLALYGVAELVDEIKIPYDSLCVACGTGTTMAGLITGISSQQTVLGIAALKNAAFLVDDVQSLLSRHDGNWTLFQDYHCGGFAKVNAKLLQFINQFEQHNSIPLEPVYTAKMLYGLYDLIEKGYFTSGHRIIAVHTGGLQGNRGYAG